MKIWTCGHLMQANSGLPSFELFTQNADFEEMAVDFVKECRAREWRDITCESFDSHLC